MHSRQLRAYMDVVLSDTSVIHLQGARQVGKTTLAWSFERDGAPYYTMDNAGSLTAAQNDPMGFIAGANPANAHAPIIIDEVQKAPELLNAIKETVDRNRRPGMFIVTGSANIHATLSVADSLAGRMETITLWPLSVGELHGVKEGLVDLLFDTAWSPAGPQQNPAGNSFDVEERVAAGGYPEAVARKTSDRRHAWFDAYVTSMMERDIRDIANIHDLTAVPRLLRLLAARAANLINYSSLSRDLQASQTTLKRYMSLLEATFLIWELPCWSCNHSSRTVKAPKLMLVDTGLACSLLRLDAERLRTERTALGGLLENWVACELAKQLGWSQTKARLHHWRLHTGAEVDIVLEDADGRIVGVEVKASHTPRNKDFTGLRKLRDQAPERFLRGVLLYLGDQVAPFEERLHAVPVTRLLQTAAPDQAQKPGVNGANL